METINLPIEDSDAGFDPQLAMNGRGLGLTSMTQWLKVVGGRLPIHSRPGGGTIVDAVVPTHV